jgi:mRNA-degrading endonuclease RelE of RelBE toxin-antitoxin system
MPRYSVYIRPEARKEIDRLPGHVRQRVRRAVLTLQDNPRPSQGKRMEYDLEPKQELWRLRLDAWRVVYLIDQEWDQVYILAARQRPPYQYEDLATLLTDVS